MSNAIKVFGSPTCVKCLMVKSYLESRDIPYVYLDITVGNNKQALLSEGFLAVPVTMKGNMRVLGFDKEKLDALITTS